MGSPITETEMEVLKTLWEHGPGSVREINEALRGKKDWAYTTVQTLLNRLREKEFVIRDESRMTHVYGAAISRDKFLRFRLRQLADDICEGALTPLVLNLVQDDRFTEEEIASFRKLLDSPTDDDSPISKKKNRRE